MSKEIIELYRQDKLFEARDAIFESMSEMANEIMDAYKVQIAQNLFSEENNETKKKS